MNAVQIELLEEYKYVDSICRDMLSAEKGVTAYIEQMEATQPVVRYKIVGWDDDYRKLKHIRWLRNKIAHSTGNVECMPSDVDSYNPDSSSRRRKALIAIVSVAALAVIAGVIIWLLKLSMEW